MAMTPVIYRDTTPFTELDTSLNQPPSRSIYYEMFEAFHSNECGIIRKFHSRRFSCCIVLYSKKWEWCGIRGSPLNHHSSKTYMNTYFRHIHTIIRSTMKKELKKKKLQSKSLTTTEHIQPWTHSPEFILTFYMMRFFQCYSIHYHHLRRLMFVWFSFLVKKKLYRASSSSLKLIETNKWIVYDRFF